jgi:hypothetical protein
MFSLGLEFSRYFAHFATLFVGVEHVGGNVLESIPAGDAIFMKVCVT